LVAFPTETVYGLGADATSDRAVAKIFAAKGRPRFNPLIVHFTALDEAKPHVKIDDRVSALAAAFWPGPLTLVLNRKPTAKLSQLVSAGLETVAIRLPANNIARELIKAARVPIAAPSANRSGDISPTLAEHVAESLGDEPAMILDGGPTKIGLESTVVDLSTDKAALLRPGAITLEQVTAVIGPTSVLPDGPDGEPEKSPGRLARHYAPQRPLRINISAPQPGEALLAFGPNVPESTGPILNLSPSGNLVEAAANFFAMLHRLDDATTDGIAAMPIPETGLGVAINDRLRRAAEPLPQDVLED
jgi:L-threonylcarbamoyladenylate synthase